MPSDAGTTKIPMGGQQVAPWVSALNKLREWDPAWAERCVEMTTNPRAEGALHPKFIELVGIGLNAMHTTLNPEGTRRHIRAALAEGASREEILFVLKCASVMSIYSCSFAAPILLQEASVGSLDDFSEVRKKRLEKMREVTKGLETMKAIEVWDEEWDCLLFLAPLWANGYIGMCVELHEKSALPTKEFELLLIAFYAAYGPKYASYTRRHIKRAFKAGATTDEIMQVLKLGAVQTMQACNVGVAILAEELERNATSQGAKA